jgi:DNA polymerase-3 subunit epsilon
MPASFVALDVETANADQSSICQIGAVTFEDGLVLDTWQSLIDPQDYFDALNVSIHGIDEDTVRGAPRFPDIAGDFAARMAGRIVVSHTAFDRVAMARVHDKYSLPVFPCTWLDTARVCRRAWPQFSRIGYGLGPVAKYCGIAFRHHEAAEDARAAGEILVRAIADTRVTLEEWLERVEGPITPATEPLHASDARDGNPDGPLFGEVLVFTGALSMVRTQAARLAASAGCSVGDGVTRATTLLVVGDTDARHLAGHERSSKHRKAEKMVRDGHALRILTETDFLALLHASS